MPHGHLNNGNTNHEEPKNSRIKAFGRVAVVGACTALLLMAAGANAHAVESDDSTQKESGAPPPADWFLGVETTAQKGLAPPAGPALPALMAYLEENLKNIKIPAGFKINVYASGVHGARQVARGDKGTLFVGSFGVGAVHAITDHGGKKEVKPTLTELKMPTGIAFRDGALYAPDIDKILENENVEASLATVPLGPPRNGYLPPTSLSQVRRVNPDTGQAEMVALGVHNSVGGDIDPRTGECWLTETAREWVSDALPGDKLNHIAKIGAHYGDPYGHHHQDNIPDPRDAMDHRCSEFTPPALKLGAHVASLGMKFDTGTQFSEAYKNNIFVAQYGSWSRHPYQGANIVRVTTDPQGKKVRNEVSASGWITGEQRCTGRPADVVMAVDGPMLIAADSAGAVYRIGHAKQRSGHVMRYGLALMALFLTNTLAQPAVPPAVQAKAATCMACHDAGGISQTTGTPSLAGQPERFLQCQRVYFRSGIRPSAVLQPMAAGLSDHEGGGLFSYFSKQKPPTPDSAQAMQSALFEAGQRLALHNRCASCHKDDRAGAQATLRTANQRENFFLKRLKDFKAGTRTGGGVAAAACVVYPPATSNSRRSRTL